LAQASRILGARYFLTGTIMKEARNCIIALELCNAPDNAVVWADRIITPVQDIMHMRSAVASFIALLPLGTDHECGVQGWRYSR
jgi:TolB-like protein